MSEKISLFYTSDGQTWADYLKDKLNSKDYSIPAESIDFNDKTADFTAKVNVFLVTPDFLELKDYWHLLESCDAKTSVAVLAGVDHAQWILAASIYKVESVLEWFDFPLEANDTCVKDLLMTIIGIYEMIGDPDDTWGELYMNIPGNKKKEQPDYAVPPSRPTGHENAVTNVFRKDDCVFLLLDNGFSGTLAVEFHEDSRIINPEFQGHFDLYSFPWKGTNQETFDVLLEGIEIGFGQIDAVEDSNNHSRETICGLPPPSRHSAFSSVSSNSLPKSVSYYNEDDDLYDYPPPRRGDTVSTYSTTSSISSESSSVIGSDLETSPNVFKDAPPEICENRRTKVSTCSNLSKLEQIRALLEDETEPLSVLCECLNIPKNTSALDDKMTSMIVATEALKHASVPRVIYGSQETSDAHWPTLVHFGAEFNLFSFCDSLLSNPFMYNACVTRNREGNFPHEVARLAGHKDLAQALKTFSSYIAQGYRGSHDSGFSQSVRLSNVSSVHDSSIVGPPVPHRGPPDYLDMTGQAKLEPPTTRTANGLQAQYSFDNDGDKTPTSTLADIFDGRAFSDDGRAFSEKSKLEKPESSSDSSTGTVKDGSGSSGEKYRINKSYTESDVVHPKAHRKGGLGFGKFWRKAKQRSYSEPGIHPEEEAVRRKQKAVIYRKGSQKTDSGTSGYSTNSEASLGRASDLKTEDSKHPKSGKTPKTKSKDRVKKLLTNVKRRNSVRIDHLMKDQSIEAPAPLPYKVNEEVF